MSSTIHKPQNIRELAQVLGVSTATISKAFTGNGRIKEETRQSVLEAAASFGFVPNPHAQRLSVGQCPDLIGLFVRYLDSGVQAEKLQVIQGQLIERGFQVPLYTGGYAFQSGAVMTSLMSSLRRQKPRAIVLSTMELVPETLDELRLYVEEGGIAVTYDSPHSLDCDRVIFDREDSTGAATRHLLELGHRRIGFFHHHFIRPDNPRFRGFEFELAKYRLAPQAHWMFEGKTDFRPEAAGADFAARFVALEPRNRPSAVVIINDHTALTFIAELARAGLRVPEDVSVVGHDDRPIAHHGLVPLSSASHPIEAIGHAVVDLLQTRLDGFNGAPREVTLRGELKIRQSSAAPSSRKIS